MCYKYLSPGSSESLSNQKGREGACLVNLPFREGLCVAQDAGPALTEARLNFLICFVACCFVFVNSGLPGIVSGDGRREGRGKEAFSPFCLFSDIINYSLRL